MLLSLMLAIGGGVGFAMGMIPLGSSDGSLFFMPTAVFGDASIIFAGAAVSSYPILLLLVAYKLISCRPRPITVWIFLAVLLLVR